MIRIRENIRKSDTREYSRMICAHLLEPETRVDHQLQPLRRPVSAEPYRVKERWRTFENFRKHSRTSRRPFENDQNTRYYSRMICAHLHELETRSPAPAAWACGICRAAEIREHSKILHCYLSQQRFHFCFETFHSRLLSRWAAGIHTRDNPGTSRMHTPDHSRRSRIHTRSYSRTSRMHTRGNIESRLSWFRTAHLRAQLTCVSVLGGGYAGVPRL